MKIKILTENVDWGYYNKFNAIVDKYMPDRGEGETMASQGVTAVNKLVYKWYNDGDVYDNTNPVGLQGWVNDLSTYANWLYKYMPETKELLDGIFDCTSDSDYEYLLKAIADTVLDEEFLAQYAEKPATSSIYEEDGPYRFIDDWDDSDDDYDYNDYDDDETGYEDDEYDYDDGEEDFDESLNTVKKSVNEELHLYKDFEDNGYVQCVTILLKDESEMPKIEDIMSRKGYHHVMSGDLTAGDFEDVEDDEDLMYSYYIEYEFNTLDEACDFIDNIPSEYEWSIYETDKDPKYDDDDDDNEDFDDIDDDDDDEDDDDNEDFDESLQSTSDFLDEALKLKNRK